MVQFSQEPKLNHIIQEWCCISFRKKFIGLNTHVFPNLDSLQGSFIVPLLCLRNTLITTNFVNLKCIKKIFKIPIQCILMLTRRHHIKNSKESELHFPNCNQFVFHTTPKFQQQQQIPCTHKSNPIDSYINPNANPDW